MNCCTAFTRLTWRTANLLVEFFPHIGGQTPSHGRLFCKHPSIRLISNLLQHHDHTLDPARGRNRNDNHQSHQGNISDNIHYLAHVVEGHHCLPGNLARRLLLLFENLPAPSQTCACGTTFKAPDLSPQGEKSGDFIGYIATAFPPQQILLLSVV